MIYIVISVGDKDMDFVIANRIKELRKSKNITQETLAEEIEVSRSKISSWETCKRDMTITDAINLANFFEISMDNLLNRDIVSRDEYMRISQIFFSNYKASIDEKIKVIQLIEDGVVKDNILEIYQKYKMTQNETKS